MAKDLCYNCKNEVTRKPGDFYFTHLGMQIKSWGTNFLCDECVKKIWVSVFEKNAKEFINVVEGKPKVNWQHYEEHFAGGMFVDQRGIFHTLLAGMGIFSYEAKGNWEIVASGSIGLNPRDEVSYFYFTNKEDAIKFALLEFASTLYRWEIRHIDKVISGKEIIQK